MLVRNRLTDRPLQKAEAAQIAHFLKLQLQDLVRRGIQAIHFLARQPQRLYQFDIAQRFSCGARRVRQFRPTIVF